MKKNFLKLLKQDTVVWSDFYQIDRMRFIRLFLRFPEFRSLVKMRFKYGEQANSSVFLKIIRILIALSCRWHNCFIYTEPDKIGTGLLLHHAFATMISAEIIGDNCHIYQQVTIGNGGGRNSHYRK